MAEIGLRPMTDHISEDDRAYLTAITDQEQAALTSLRAVRGSFEAHLAKKYSLKQGDTVQPDGTIQRAAPAPDPSA